MAFVTVRYTMRRLQSCAVLQQINKQLVTQVKGYSRWAHRRPVRIVNEKQLFGNPKDNVASQDILEDAEFTFARRKNPELQKENKKSELEKPDKNKTLNDDGTPIYTKLKLDDPLMSKLMIDIKSRKKQKKEDRIVLEGYRLIEDAIKAGLVPEIIIFSRSPDLVRLPIPKNGVKLYKIPYQTIQLWSDLTTSPGIMALFKTPDVSSTTPADDSIPTTVICDNVREPGNLGAILRVAAGAGCEKIILTKGCVDLWNPKVLRSAAGAHFRLPIHMSETWAEVQYLISENANIFIADSNVKSSDISKSISSPSSSSSSDSDSESSDSESEVEPDNETKKVLNEIREDFSGTSSEENTTSKSNKKVETRSSIKREEALYENAENLPVIPYFATDYTNNETIIIVGGETEGISPESISLTLRRNGVRLNIPLTNGVDSLNSGTALGVILFEIKRQFLSRLNDM